MFEVGKQKSQPLGLPNVGLAIDAIPLLGLGEVRRRNTIAFTFLLRRVAAAVPQTTQRNRKAKL
jgi:hypothetical protein